MKDRSEGVGIWVLLVLLVLAGGAGLLLQGLVSRSEGRPSALAPGDRALAVGGSVVIPGDGNKGVARSLPSRTVALTFDDGPSSRWTPRILSVLRHEGVPATFFVSPTAALRSPGLLAAAQGQGDELGSALSSASHFDLALAQLAVSGAVDDTSRLVRLPATTPDALNRSELASEHRLLAAGYDVVLFDRNGNDTGKARASSIVADAQIASPRGAIVLLHDGGTDEAATLRALPAIIRHYRSAHYHFVTVSRALASGTPAALAPAGWLAQLQGRALGAALLLSSTGVSVLYWLVVIFAAMTLLRLLIVVCFARRHVGLARRAGHAAAPRGVTRLRTVRGAGDSPSPPVTVIVPAYNEAVGIEAAMRSLVASDYSDFEILVVDDGSTDGTADIVEALALSGVRVVRKRNAGKARALNTGVAHCDSDIVVMVDGDTVFEPQALRRLVGPLVVDGRIGAVSGNTKVGNRKGLVGRWQHLEYVNAFNLERRLYDLWHCMPTVPGAIGAFRRAALLEVGGVSDDTLAEDTDLTMALHRAGWLVVYQDDARAWTEAPATLRQLSRQRYRWCYGTLQATWKHRRAIVEDGPGRGLGRIGIPSLLLFQILLPLIGPAIDLYAIYGLLFLNPVTTSILWAALVGLQALVTAYALSLDGERFSTLWALPLQQFVYRQLMYLVVIRSVASALNGIRLRWQKLPRTGDLMEGLATTAFGASTVPPKGTLAPADPTTTGLQEAVPQREHAAV